jgi:hypothetical protein
MAKKTNPKSEMRKLKKALLEPTNTVLVENCKPVNGRSMGIGRKGDPCITFARKFRWTLASEGLPEHFFNKVKIDYKNKTIDFDYLDVTDGKEGFHAHAWADNLDNRPQTTLTLKTYDGCGRTLYTVVFKQLRLLGFKADFDYAVSDPSESKISVAYNTLIREVHHEEGNDNKESGCDGFTCEEQRPVTEGLKVDKPRAKGRRG